MIYQELSPDARLAVALQCGRRGQAAEVRRDLESALAEYTEGRTILAGLDPTPLLANLLRWSASIHRDMGHVERAEQLYCESQEVAEVTGAKAAQAAVINCRAVIAQRRGNIDDAVMMYRRAARLAAEAGELRLAGMIEQNLGVLANIRGDFDGALVRYRAALRAFREAADEEAMSWVLNNMGMLLTDMDLPKRAEQSFGRGLAMATRRGDRPMVGILNANYAECLIAMRRWEAAEESLGIALEAARDGQDSAREGEALKLLSVLERERGNHEEASRSLEQALEIAQRLGHPLLVAETLRERGQLGLIQGRAAEALSDWQQALAGFTALDATLDVGDVRGRIETLKGTSPQTTNEEALK